MTTISGTLPSGLGFAALIDTEEIAVLVDDKICCVHPQWMTKDQARAVAQKLLTLTEQE